LLPDIRSINQNVPCPFT